MVVNVAGGDVDDYLACLDRLDRAEGIDGYELNISCPNIANGLDLGRDPAAAARLVDAARDRTGRHLMVKLSPNVTDIAAVARAVEEAGAELGVGGQHLRRDEGPPRHPGARCSRAGERAA